MKRLIQMTALAALAAMGSMFAPSAPATTQAEPAGKMNVLFIAVDDLKPLIGAFGDAKAVTPNLDRLAAMGVAFTNAHCQQAVCAPSRVSLLTGLRPDTTKVWDLQTEFRAALPDVVTLPQRFKMGGYQTIGMGKIYDPRSAGGRQSMDAVSWSEPFLTVNSPSDDTFGYLDPATVEQVAEAKQSPDWPRGYGRQLDFAFPEGKPAVDAADVPDEAYEDGAMTEVAKTRLAGFADSGEAFFLAVGFKKPHLPFNAPQKYWDLYDRESFELAEYQQAPEGAPDYATQPGWELRSSYDAPDEGPISAGKQRELIHGYYAATSYIDAQVGELLDALEAEGLAENTIIILWGDHGWHLGDHDMWCKHTNYEQATRSPLIVADPRLEKGVTNASPVEFVDIFPTLMELTGLEHDGELHGASLAPILRGEADRVKEVAVSQYPRGGGRNAKMGYAYRTDRYRLVRWREQNSKDDGEINGPVVDVELYDYEADPLERRNLADDPEYADIRSKLEAMADAFRAKNGYETQG